MTSHILATGSALAALFLVAGCGTATPGDPGQAAARHPEQQARADVVRPPAIADEASEAQAEPLNDAGEIASEISSNTSIERVPVEGGLAWRQDGEVVRTASSDGQRIAYFHPGENRPFLVQDGGLAYAYERGRPELAYDSAGRPQPVDAAAQAKASRLAAESLREHAQAERATPVDARRP